MLVSPTEAHPGSRRGLWHLITGEYPPQAGGIADYTAQLAGALAGTGAEVHVWTSGGPDGEDPEGVTVHRSAGRWSRSDLRRLDADLDAFAPARRLFVQYTPNVWGYKGLNLGFCRWLLHRRARGDDVRVMFHEVWYTLEPRDKLARRLLVLVQRRMARTLMDAGTAATISIPAWEPLLRSVERAGVRRPITWLPVPSNIAVVDDIAGVAALRHRLAPRGETIVGSFGTFGGAIGELLAQVFPRVLDSRDDRIGLFIGRGGDRFVSRLLADHPRLAGRLIATGGLPSAELSIHLQVCDLLVQPYPDGVSSRRGSLMAGLAHGIPALSNPGPRSEPLWAQSGCVALASTPEALVQTAESLLACPEARAALGAAGCAVYREHFAIERIVEAITGHNSYEAIPSR